MSIEKLAYSRDLIHQVSGDSAAPPLVYLPGVHGDWTIFERLRPLLNAHFRVIEITYPRRTDWKIEDFGSGLAKVLDELEVGAVHLLGESFGSLVCWEFGLSRPKRVRSFTLAGGFCQSPPTLMVDAARWGLSILPSPIFEFGIDTYVGYRGKRGEKREALGPEALPYPATRTTEGRLATVNRMQIIRRTDVRPRLGEVRFPVSYLGGSADGVVPVQREVQTLKDRLAPECRFHSFLVPGAPHIILASHPVDSARHILDWAMPMEEKTSPPKPAAIKR